MSKILKSHKAQFPNFSFCACQNSILYYYLQNLKDIIQIRVYKVNKKRISHFSQVCFSKSEDNFKKISG